METIAVTITDLQNWGCPNCGYLYGSFPLQGNGAGVWICGECGTNSIVLTEGLTVSPIGVLSAIGQTVYPQLAEHPRTGMLPHGIADTQPEGGGEFFRPRGIGSDMCACFVCGSNNKPRALQRLLHNIAAFVRTKEAGERVVAMFKQGARLDYRELQPTHIQVKIGACADHLPNLEMLFELTQGGVITQEMIHQAGG